MHHVTFLRWCGHASNQLVVGEPSRGFCESSLTADARFFQAGTFSCLLVCKNVSHLELVNELPIFQRAK